MKHLQVFVLHATALNQRGYSDVRLWPCYLVYASTILFLAPFTGLLIAFVAVSTLAFLIAFKVANPAPRPNSFAIYQSVPTEVVYRPVVMAQRAPVVAAEIALPPPAPSPSHGEPTANNALILTATSI